jgi:FMN phosphatase YigB (HAD superfamily)
MIISFDLDDTLIPGIKRFPLEPKIFWQHLFSRERIRFGTIALMKELKAKQHKIYVYTTSHRSPAYIRRLFLTYGIRIDKAINQDVHIATLRERAKVISKYPPAFNIDWHIDDSPGVAIEGERNQFKTIIIAEDDANWTNTVLRYLHPFADLVE